MCVLTASPQVTPRFLKMLTDVDWVQKDYWLSDATGVTVTPYGVLIMCRLPVHSLALHLMTTMLGRRALIANVSVPVSGSDHALPLRVATAHLESMAGEPWKSNRIAQLMTIFPLLADADNALFMGDFNFHPSEP